MILRALAALTALLLLAAPVAAQTRTVAVTFDDLPYQANEADYCDREKLVKMTREFVDMLRPLQTRGSAYVNEHKVCERLRARLLPELLTVWLDAGLELGNHTATHLDIHQNTVETYLADVDAGAVITRPLLAARGEKLKWFRHPFLHTGGTPEKKAAIDAGLAQRGYTVAPVTIDNADWMFASVYRHVERHGDTELMRKIGEAYVAHMVAVLDHNEPYSAELNGGREPAQILLLHANSLNRDWYPQIHALYLARGYRFVPLEEALADPIYARQDTFAEPRGVSWLQRWAITAGQEPRWPPQAPHWIRAAYEAID